MRAAIALAFMIGLAACASEPINEPPDGGEAKTPWGHKVFCLLNPESDLCRDRD